MMDDLRAEFKQQQKGKQPVEEPNTEKLRNESDESSEAEKGMKGGEFRVQGSNSGVVEIV